ncbi:MAG: hypothetical protein ACI9GW_001699 [Halieaceae bacterium]|jgi:hypothetical protein
MTNSMNYKENGGPRRTQRAGHRNVGPLLRPADYEEQGEGRTGLSKWKNCNSFLKPNSEPLPNSVPTLNGVGQLLEVLDLNIIDCKT